MRQRIGEETSAGGVVWCKGRVLVLRNFRGEYVFPKGHLEAEETPAAAAIREVAEEAGLMAAIVSQLPDTKYSYQRIYGGVQEKRVHWFNMEVTDTEVVVDEEEIHWGAFMPPFEAAGRLTFELDRNLLQQSLAMMQERSN